MTTIRILTKVDGEVLHLPELKPMIGKTVEVIVTEIVPASREEFYAEAAHVPQTPEEQEAQEATFRAWRADPRFERFWPLIDRWLGERGTSPANGPAASHGQAAS